MNKFAFVRVGRLTLSLSVGLGLCCEAALAQGMAEYAGVTSIPKPVPKSGAISGTLNSLYGAPGKSLAGATSGASTSTPRQSPVAQKSAAGKALPKQSKPAVIMSGDLPGSQVQAHRAAVLGVSKQANDTYSAGMEAKKKGKLDEAEAQLRKSVVARQSYWADIDKKIPDIYVELGEINAARNEDNKASEDLKQSLAFYSKFYGPGSNHRLKPLLLLSDVQLSLGEKNLSYESYKQAYQLSSRAKMDEYNPVELRINTIKKALEVGRFRDAAELSELATTGGERAKLSQDQLLAVMADHAAALNGMSRTRDAAEVLAEAERIKASASATPPQTPETK